MKLATTLNTLTILSAFVVATACTHSTDNNSTTTSNSISQTSSSAEGGSDRGGGNLYRGKPLESYIIDPTTMAAYASGIKPIMDKLNIQVEPSVTYDGLQIIMTWALQKTWYFLPGPLEKLPSEKIASAVATEQGALQDFKTVWIDSDLYAKMPTDDDRVKLILHEMLMSIKLLRLDSIRDQCLATNGNNDAASCDKDSAKPLGKPSDLTPKDYEEIRSTVLEILQWPSTVSKSQVDDLMAKNNFGFPLLTFNRSYEKSTIGKDELTDMIRAASLTRQMPKNLFSYQDIIKADPDFLHDGIRAPMNWKSSGTCQIDWKVDDNAFQGAVTVTSTSGDSTSWPFAITFASQGAETDKSNELTFHTDKEYDFGQTVHIVTFGQVVTHAKKDELTVGDLDRKIEIIFTGRAIEAVRIYNVVLTSYMTTPTETSQQWSYVSAYDIPICAEHDQYILRPFGQR